MKSPPQINVSDKKVLEGLEWSSLDWQPVDGHDIGTEGAPPGTMYAISGNGVRFLMSPDRSVVTDLSPGWEDRLAAPFPPMRRLEEKE
jgi:hypothetical protein